MNKKREEEKAEKARLAEEKARLEQEEKEAKLRARHMKRQER